MQNTAAIALSGLQAAQRQMQASAHNVANLSTAGFRRTQVHSEPSPQGGVTTTLAMAPQEGASLETDAVALLQAKNAFLANLAVFKSHEQMMGTLLKLTA